jgi:hypothetical protein
VLVAGDIRDPDHCRSIVQRAVDELGGLDILVNNAAHQATFEEIGEISDDEWRMTFEVNIHAMFYLTKAAVPHMKPGSAIINTASVTSDMPNQTLLAYSTTKGAIQNFTGGLAQMLADKGVRVNAVAPGPDLDASHSRNYAGGNGQESWQTHAVQTSRAASGTGYGLRDAGRSSIQLYLGNHGGGHWWKAVHIDVRRASRADRAAGASIFVSRIFAISSGRRTGKASSPHHAEVSWSSHARTGLVAEGSDLPDISALVPGLE